MLVISFLSLILAVFRIFVRAFWWGLGLGARIPSVSGGLTSCVSLWPLRQLAPPALALLRQLLPLHLLLFSGIDVSDISPV